MTKAQAQQVALELKSGRRIGAIKAIREAKGVDLRAAKQEMEMYLPTIADSNSPAMCAGAAVRYLQDNPCISEPTFEDWFRQGVEFGFFNLIKQVREV